ncbi:MAG: TrmO family methyltransferase domain-containing protein [Pseudonocardiaceae bacterium]
MSDGRYVLRPIGWVESPLQDRDLAPKQGDEEAPDAWLVFEPDVRDGLRDLQAGTEVIVLTWLDRASRDVLVVHPRGDPARPATGVFSTRSAESGRAAPSGNRVDRWREGARAQLGGVGRHAHRGRQTGARSGARTVIAGKRAGHWSASHKPIGN